MTLCYNKLWNLLIDRGLSKTDLRNMTGLCQSTIAKLSNSSNVNTNVLERICTALECRIEDVVEIKYNEDLLLLNPKNNFIQEEINLFSFNVIEKQLKEAFGDDDYVSDCKSALDMNEEELFSYFDELNNDNSHSKTGDDVCTPMNCVKKMLDYVPDELWKRKSIKVLDPCCGNGNFGAYCMTKTNPDNIYYNDLNIRRIKNCIKILNPKHWSCCDAFSLKGEFDTKYDLIMANPPYSGGGNKNKSLSNEFIEFSIDALNDNGYLCFVTPNNWMTYNNNNTTLKKLLENGSFVVIDNDIKKYFTGIGSSFTVMIWQKNVFNNKTTVINNFLIKDKQTDVIIPKDINFIPLYLSNDIISIVKKVMSCDVNKFNYRCDLHNFTKKDLLSDIQDDEFRYRTIHTARITRFAKIKQDIFEKWIIVIPLSTYYVPYIEHKTNTTQSVGYIAFEKEIEAKNYIKEITKNHFKLVVHLTRYGNFNNIMVLKHLNFDKEIFFTEQEMKEIEKLIEKIKY